MAFDEERDLMSGARDWLTDEAKYFRDDPDLLNLKDDIWVCDAYIAEVEPEIEFFTNDPESGVEANPNVIEVIQEYKENIYDCQKMIRMLNYMGYRKFDDIPPGVGLGTAIY